MINRLIRATTEASAMRDTVCVDRGTGGLMVQNASIMNDGVDVLEQGR